MNMNVLSLLALPALALLIGCGNKEEASTEKKVEKAADSVEEKKGHEHGHSHD